MILDTPPFSPPLRAIPAVGEDAEAAGYEDAFRGWAARVVDEWGAANPGEPPFALAAFDGCTYAPDVCRDCCLIHDLGCWFSRTLADRMRANAALYRCIRAKAAYEGALWRWFWPIVAVAYDAATGLWALATFRGPR